MMEGVVFDQLIGIIISSFLINCMSLNDRLDCGELPLSCHVLTFAALNRRIAVSAVHVVSYVRLYLNGLLVSPFSISNNRYRLRNSRVAMMNQVY